VTKKINKNKKTTKTPTFIYSTAIISYGYPSPHASLNSTTAITLGGKFINTGILLFYSRQSGTNNYTKVELILKTEIHLVVLVKKCQKIYFPHFNCFGTKQ